MFFDLSCEHGILSSTENQFPGRQVAAIFMPKELTIVLKNRMFSNAILMALLSAGFERIGTEYLHDGVHLHLKAPPDHK